MTRFGRSAASLGPRVVVTLSVIGALAACATPEADARRAEVRQAQAVEAMCSACHGDDGTSRSARAPVLAGQLPGYLVAQLNAFRDRSRADADARTFMWPMTTALSDSMIDSLANHFAALPPVRQRSTAVADAAAGRALYADGVPARGIPPCAGCHGDHGAGLAVFPRLAGQHDDYLRAQLAAYADHTRTNPIMEPIASLLSPEEIANLSAHLVAE